MFLLILFLFAIQNISAEETAVSDKGLTHKAIVRTPAAHNKTLKVRLKDISRFAGIRDNQLVGYGLVVGLNGTGDTLASSPYTKESLTGMLERLGVNIRNNAIPSGKNVAAVMVTAKLPPFARTGSTIDIVVSALGDAKDLNGGTLLVTPLMGADGEVYAVGQGEIIVSGYAAIGAAASQTTGVPTTGKIPNGAIVEKEIFFHLTDLRTQTLSLHSHDLTTARRIAESINNHFKHNVARTKDSGSIEIDMPSGSEQHVIEAMTQIEQLEIEPDQVAKVIIDPSGVIVLGQKVRISPVALTHGSVTVRIAESASVYQPNPFTQVLNPAIDQQALQTLGVTFNAAMNSQNQSPQLLQGSVINAYNVNLGSSNNNGVVSNGNASNLLSQSPSLINATLNSNTPLQQATVVKQTDLNVTDAKGKFAIIDCAADLEDLVNGLNLLGTSPREMAQILQSIKASGALHAEVVVN
jgi:flagellar P-ring protein precursor FlgI